MTPPTVAQQYGALLILDFISDLFTATTREQFTRDEILVLLSNVRADQDLFDPLVSEAYDAATQNVENEFL